MVMCLVLALLFWFLKTFTKDYETTLELPVRYTELASDQVVLNELPSSLRVEVSAWGFSLLNYYLGTQVDTLVLPCGQLSDRKSGAAWLPTKPLHTKVSDQLTGNMRVERLITDSVYFVFDRKVTRILPVKPNVNATFAPQYMQAGPLQLLPEAVAVSGPASILDTMKLVPTEPVDFSKLEANATATVAFAGAAAHRLVQCEPSKMLVTIPVDAFTEATVEVPITLRNVPDSLTVQLFPKTVEVTFTVAFQEYTRVKADDFTAEIDFAAQQGRGNRLQVSLSRVPGVATRVRYSPQKIDYRIRKR